MPQLAKLSALRSVYKDYLKKVASLAGQEAPQDPAPSQLPLMNSAYSLLQSPFSAVDDLVLSFRERKQRAKERLWQAMQRRLDTGPAPASPEPHAASTSAQAAQIFTGGAVEANASTSGRSDFDEALLGTDGLLRVRRCALGRTALAR
jgi:hypothetical protein